MLEHARMISMLEPSYTQHDILERLASNQKLIPNTGKIGLSSASIGQSKINRQSFENNKKNLLDENLIRLVHQEKHGIQVWKYYDITILGFLILLKYINAKNLLQKSIIRKFNRFLPLIASRWNELENILGEILIIILKRSLDQFNLNTIAKSLYLDEDVFSSIMFEEITVISDDSSNFRIELIRHYYNMPSTVKAKIKPKLKPFFVNFDDISNDISRRLTFVFYYNLIRIFHDNSFELNVYSQYWRQKSHRKWKERIGPLLQFSKDYSKWSKNLEKMKENIEDLIKNDGELCLLLSDNIDETHKKFTMPKTVEFLSKLI